MAGVAITIDHEFDDKKILAAFQKLAAASADMEPAFIDIGEGLRNSTIERFDWQESPEGELWEMLDPKYQARKKKNADKILQLEGYMFGTLAYNTHSEGLELGSGRDQAASMQFGDDDRNIPARPFLGVSRDDEWMILDILHDHLQLSMH